MAENSNVLSGVFAYAKVTEPAPKYQSDDKEFSIDIIVDKATYKSWGKSFGKQKGKVVDNDDFKEIYKIDPPYEDQDEQYVIKLKKPAQYKDGTELPKEYWPKILLKTGNKAVPLVGKLIANGSEGKVSYEVTENSYGTFAKLKSILVEELIEYKKQGGDAGEDFGIEVDYGAEEFKTDAQEPPKKEENKPVKPKAASKKVPEPIPEDEVFDPDIPF